MKGLLYKDWSILISQYRKNILLILILYLGMAYLFDTPFMLYALVFMFGIYTQSAVSFDEKSHWDIYAHTLPVSPAAIIGSKYLLGLIAIFGGFVLGMAAFLLAASALSLLYFSLSLPLSYRFGSERARSVVMVAILLLVVIVMAAMMLVSSEQMQAVQRFFGFRGPAEIWDASQGQYIVMDVEYGSLTQWVRNLHFWWLVGGCVVFSVLLYAASWAASNIVYKRRQF